MLFVAAHHSDVNVISWNPYVCWSPVWSSSRFLQLTLACCCVADPGSQQSVTLARLRLRRWFIQDLGFQSIPIVCWHFLCCCKLCCLLVLTAVCCADDFQYRDTPAAYFKWHKAPITSVEWNPNDESVLAVSSADDSVCYRWPVLITAKHGCSSAYVPCSVYTARTVDSLGHGVRGRS